MKFLALLVCFSWGFLNVSECQTSSFSKIEYGSFDVNSYRTKIKGSAFVNLYCTIYSNGLIVINNKDDYHKTHTYYSFQISKAEIKILNSIFDVRKSLKQYLVKTQLESNSFYAGSYDFYRVMYKNGIIDSICIIPPFMSESFQRAYELLDNIFYVRKKRRIVKAFQIPTDFMISLKSCYLKSKHLPKIQNPPPFRIENQ